MSVGRENHTLYYDMIIVCPSPPMKFPTKCQIRSYFDALWMRDRSSLFRNSECRRPKYGPGTFSADFFTAQTYLGGGYKHVLFSLYLGKIPILTNIFQRG